VGDTMLVTINGPGALWSATAEIIEWKKVGAGHFHDHRTVRNLFVARREEEFGGGVGMLPGTMVALCAFLEVTVNLGGEEHVWFHVPQKDEKNKDKDDQYKAYQSLLLLQADPEEWRAGKDFPACVCIGGEIDLQQFKTQPPDWAKVFGHWSTINKPATQPIAHSSGFSFRGTSRLPWSDAEIDSLVRVSTDFPLPDAAPPDSLRLTLDSEAMQADPRRFGPSMEQFRQEFSRLAKILLQPVKFDVDNDGNKKDWQRWLFLDLVNKLGVPQFHWDFSPKTHTGPKTPPFKLERGEVQLLFADQPPGEKDVEQRSLLTANVEARFEKTPGGIKILFGDGRVSLRFDRKLIELPKIPAAISEKFEIDAKNRLVVWKLDESPRLEDMGDALKRPLLSVAEAAALEALSQDQKVDESFRHAVTGLLAELKSPAYFKYTFGSSPAKPTETVEVFNLRASYNAIEAAALLRRQHALQTPDVGDVVVEDSLLWGFMPLEDGWAQLPFLNLTEQLYFDASQKAEQGGQQEGTEDEAAELALETPLLSGAAVFGNDRADVFDAQSGQHAWNVVLLDGRQYCGTIVFNKKDDEKDEEKGEQWELANSSLVVLQPDVDLNGFLWLGLDPPTAADALPAADNWVTALRPISLRSLSRNDPYPSPFILHFSLLNLHNETLDVPQKQEQFFSSPTLDDWGFIYEANTQKHNVHTELSVLEALLVKGLWAHAADQVDDSRRAAKFEEIIAGLKKSFWADLPLVWRRHPRMPLIQSLPITQSKTPPNFPCKSRQLVPFQLNVGAAVNELPLPSVWRFNVGREGAGVFPTLDLSSNSRIAQQWRDARALKMAALGVPGLALLADENVDNALITQEGADPSLRPFPAAQYLYGLPYTEQLYALAQLPKGIDEEARAQTEGEAETPPLALTRKTYKRFWDDLSEKAELSTADADKALARVKAPGTDKGQLFIQHLIEPFVWNMQTVTLDAQTYPGALTFKDTSGAELKLGEENLLSGFNGKFGVTATGEMVKSDSGTYEIKAGSLKAVVENDTAVVENNKARDQRGLLRGHTERTAGGIYKTELKRQIRKTELKGGTRTPALDKETVTLYTLQKDCELVIDADTTWGLWFRDLPVSLNGFERSSTLNKDTAEDVNDPSATATERAHLTGYEWRLAKKAKKPKPAAKAGKPEPAAQSLPLLGFDFYPLTFEGATFDGGTKDALKSVKLIGRLQLPGMKKEVPELGNTVSVVFERPAAGEPLKLKSIHAPRPVGIPEGLKAQGYWQLSPKSAHELRLSWNQLDYDAKDFFSDSDGEVHIGGALEFFLFGARWTLTGAMSFKPGEKEVGFNFDSDQFAPADPLPVRLSGATLKFDGALSAKAITVDLTFVWGKVAKVPNDAPLKLEAGATIDLTAEEAKTGELRADINASLLFAKPNSQQKNIQKKAGLKVLKSSLSDGALQLNFEGLQSAPANLQLLPGMRLNASGFKGYAVMAFSLKEKEAAVGQRLKFICGLVEAIIPCEWGARMSDGPSDERLFGSSSGSLFAGLTLSGTENNYWATKLLLNGSLEVKNLISWPAQKRLPDGLRMVRFNQNQSKVDEIIGADSAVLAKVADFLKVAQNRDVSLRLEGHDDNTATYQASLQISHDRAEKIQNDLINNHGISKDRIKLAIGFSSALPIDTNDDREGRQNNRRVEFVIDEVLLPAAHPEGTKLHHLRHTMTALLNQHEVPSEALGFGADQLLLNFKPDTSWQFLCTVEHLLVDVTQEDGGGFSSSNERRWTVVQEIRLAHPSRFRAFLSNLDKIKVGDELHEKEKDVKTINPVKDKTDAKKLKEVNYGYQREALLNLLLTELENQSEQLKETLIVEASSIHWILPEAKAQTSFTNLQYLPTSVQRAVLSSPQDFSMREERAAAAKDGVRPPPERTLWLLLQLPFLGRLQDVTRDMTAGGWEFQRDPILNIKELRKQAGDLPKLSLSFASMADKAPIKIDISDFDYSRFRQLRRLDPATLEESWFRLHHPPRENGDGADSALASVMASLPADSPGRLSRSALLNSLFNEFRGALPPGVPADDAPGPKKVKADDDLTWRRNNLFVLQGYENEDQVKDSNRFYGFHLVGAQLQTSSLAALKATGAIFVAATSLPANLKAGEQGVDNRQPVSFAVSPYLGIDMRPLPAAGGAEKLLIVHAELIGLDREGKSLTVIATQLFQEDSAAKSSVVEQWGAETADRLAADSPIALLRVRKIFEIETDGEHLVRVSYEFFTLPRNPLRPLPAKHVRQIRLSTEALHYAEGQFGGLILPSIGADSADFEAAPPQTRAVQPIHFEPAQNGTERPFGLSGVRFQVQVAKDKRGIIGKLSSSQGRRLWWSVVSQHVQYALPDGRRLLPKNFRARYIPSLLPTVPNLPLPEDIGVNLNVQSDSDNAIRLETTQFVVPGSYDYIITGARAGAQFTIRNSIQTQTISDVGGRPEGRAVLTSGSVPVQHRMPRPVPLPKNESKRKEAALQTWASFFEAEEQLKQTQNPYDTALLMKENSEAVGFRLTLLSAEEAEALKDGKDAGGAHVRLLTPDDQAMFWFLLEATPAVVDFKQFDRPEDFKDGDPPQQWDITLSLVADSRRLALKKLAHPTEGDKVKIKDLYFSEPKVGEGEEGKERELLREFLSDLPHGALLRIEVQAERLADVKVKGYKQTLVFPLRYSTSGLPASALRPVFIQFEDPEYNRRLSSQTAQSSRTYSHKTTLGQSHTTTLTLVADRREYNPTSEINFVVLSSNAEPQGSIELRRVDKVSGVMTTLTKLGSIPVGTLVRVDLKQAASPPLNDNESVLLIYQPQLDKSQPIQLRVDIVRQPVTPVPEAAFALLRLQAGRGAECRRFAWSPEPSRIELINPEDLCKGYVRRRAIFQWTDTTRASVRHKYALQKITPSGSTHFPPLKI
jgi:hypothetical protein